MGSGSRKVLAAPMDGLGKGRILHIRHSGRDVRGRPTHDLQAQLRQAAVFAEPRLRRLQGSGRDPGPNRRGPAAWLP
jgi:hypothetical protein